MQLIRRLLSNFYPTCFGHHYAHHQENNTVYCCLWCSALVVLAVVVWSWVVRCLHCVKVTVRLPSHSANIVRPSSTQPQPAQPVQNTICSSTRSSSPDDGHNDARNMSRQKFDNKHRISCILLVSLSSSYEQINLYISRCKFNVIRLEFPTESHSVHKIEGKCFNLVRKLQCQSIRNCTVCASVERG